MFDKNAKEDLIKIKNNMLNNYISIFNDGTTCTDNGEQALNHRVDKLDGFLSNIDAFLERSLECLCRNGVDFDKVEYEFIFGLIFKEDSLGENKEILPTSVPLKERVRYYTEGVTAYKNNKEVKKLTPAMMINYQGYVNYDKLVSSALKEGLTLSGPKSFSELKELITSGKQQPISLSVDLTNEKEKEKPKSRRRSLFR